MYKNIFPLFANDLSKYLWNLQEFLFGISFLFAFCLKFSFLLMFLIVFFLVFCFRSTLSQFSAVSSLLLSFFVFLLLHTQICHWQVFIKLRNNNMVIYYLKRLISRVQGLCKYFISNWVLNFGVNNPWGYAPLGLPICESNDRQS